MPQESPTQILIVDDEVAHLKALSHTLSEHGFLVTRCNSAQAALNEMSSRPFDLVLADLMIPEMGGIAFLRAALEKDPHMVGIVMSGEGAISTAVEAMKTGAFDYILKPFKLNMILPVLSRALAMRQLRIQNAALELSVRTRTGELETANRELEAFSYSVSHDLRAPLRHVIAYVGALNEDAGSTLSEAGHRYVGGICKAADRMTALIDALLTFSRLGRVALRPAPVNMAGLVKEALEVLPVETQGRNLRWKVQTLPTVSGDRTMLKEVWVNLISNAIKFTRPRNPATITIGCAESGGEWRFFVQDNGVGFDMAYATKLFGVFQRFHDAKEFEGAGIGLANVRRSISRHGGRTWAESKPDEGTTIFFSLPQSPPPASPE